MQMPVCLLFAMRSIYPPISKSSALIYLLQMLMLYHNLYCYLPFCFKKIFTFILKLVSSNIMWLRNLAEIAYKCLFFIAAITDICFLSILASLGFLRNDYWLFIFTLSYNISDKEKYFEFFK